MKEKGYNGWSNYETWLVSLWADNDEAGYRGRRRLAQQTWDDTEADGSCTHEERATLELAKNLRTEAEDANPLAHEASLWADLIGASLSEVNWHEIAEDLILDVRND